MLRHGQSEWNKENRFTGWVDVDVSDEGLAQARQAGVVIRERKLDFDVAFTSYLKRAVRTLWAVLEETDRMWMPVHTDWRLNERHYGDLQGKNKDETREQFGAEQVQIWRRSYATPPPPLAKPAALIDRRYAEVDVPVGESLKDTLARVMPCWRERLEPELAAGRNMLIAAHGNSLRALAKHLDGMDDEQIMQFEIPTGVPLVYQLDDKLKVVSREFIDS